MSSVVVRDIFQFGQPANSESHNRHALDPEFLLQFLQIVQIAFSPTHSGGLQAGLDIRGQHPYSNSIRCFDKASGLPNDTAAPSLVRIFSNLRSINDLGSYDSRTLLLQLLLVLVSQDRHTFGILDYLASAEAAEEDVWLRDDIRIAWITVLYASQGNPIPHIAATYQVLGLHPDKVGPAILARREALLGPSPKKQPQPVKEKAYAAKQG